MPRTPTGLCIGLPDVSVVYVCCPWCMLCPWFCVVSVVYVCCPWGSDELSGAPRASATGPEAVGVRIGLFVAVSVCDCVALSASRSAGQGGAALRGAQPY